MVKGTSCVKNETGPKLRPPGPVKFSFCVTGRSLISLPCSQDLAVLTCWLINRCYLTLLTLNLFSKEISLDHRLHSGYMHLIQIFYHTSLRRKNTTCSFEKLLMAFQLIPLWF